MLTTWREIIKRAYPGQQYLLDIISSPFQLSIEKLSNGGWIMTYTCNAAHKFRRFLIEAITETANKEGMTSNQINIFEAGKLDNILLHDLKMKTLMHH